ncbi:MAG: hypothetical protein R3D59_14820 [Paracoccaceae bacterium]
MDMSTHPTTDKTKTSLPGEPHNRDMSNPGELWAFSSPPRSLAASA